MIILLKLNGDRGSAVVKPLSYKSEGPWFDSRWCHWNFLLTKSFRSHDGPGVASASNRNENQEYFLGVKTAGAWCWQPYHHSGPLSRNLGTLTSWNPLGDIYHKHHKIKKNDVIFLLVNWPHISNAYFVSNIIWLHALWSHRHVTTIL